VHDWLAQQPKDFSRGIYALVKLDEVKIDVIVLYLFLQ
jgi:hypothetical protein